MRRFAAEQSAPVRIIPLRKYKHNCHIGHLYTHKDFRQRGAAAAIAMSSRKTLIIPALKLHSTFSITEILHC